MLDAMRRDGMDLTCRDEIDSALTVVGELLYGYDWARALYPDGLVGGVFVGDDYIADLVSDMCLRWASLRSNDFYDAGNPVVGRTLMDLAGLMLAFVGSVEHRVDDDTDWNAKAFCAVDLLNAAYVSFCRDARRRWFFVMGKC